MLRTYALCFGQEGKYKFAARHFSRVVDYLQEEDMLVGDEKRKRDALVLSAYLNMAACHLKLDNNLEVVHSCENALEMEPRSEKALYRRATVCMIAVQTFIITSTSNFAPPNPPRREF